MWPHATYFTVTLIRSVGWNLVWGLMRWMGPWGLRTGDQGSVGVTSEIVLTIAVTRMCILVQNCWFSFIMLLEIKLMRWKTETEIHRVLSIYIFSFKNWVLRAAFHWIIYLFHDIFEDTVELTIRLMSCSAGARYFDLWGASHAEVEALLLKGKHHRSLLNAHKKLRQQRKVHVKTNFSKVTCAKEDSGNLLFQVYEPVIIFQ